MKRWNFIQRWIINRQLKKDFDAMIDKHDGKMNKIAQAFVNTGRVISISTTRFGYVIHTKNRGIIELHGTDNQAEEMWINPQNEW
jgi:hypothetical protein